MQLRFGEFDLDVRAHELRRRGVVVELEARALDVLLYLVRHRGRLVPKQELIDHVWGGVIGESTLTRLVSLIRAALEEDVRAPRHLVTTWGRGYRFVAAVEESASSAASRSEDAFVGRALELKHGERELARVLDGAFRMLWVSGPAGIGKSSLVRELAARAASRGASVCIARCDESDGAPALWPWIQVIRACVEGRSPATLRQLLGSAAADLAPLAPELAAQLRVSAEPPRLDVMSSRFRMFDGFARFLRAAARAEPRVVVLDDLHHADESSLRLLEFLAAHLDGCPLLIAACFRENGAAPGTPLARVLGTAGGAHVELGPLDESGSAQLLRSLTSRELPDAWLRTVHERCGGNPLFLSHLARSLPDGDEDETWRVALSSWRPPATLVEAVRRDLERLAPDTVKLLELAAIAGGEPSLSLLRDAAELSPAAVAAAIDQASRERVVEPLPGELDHYRFCHALSSEVLYTALSVGGRIVGHARIAAVLERGARPEDAAHASQLAHHSWLARSVLDAERVRRAQIRAAHAALRSLGFEDVLRYGQRALDVGGEWHDPEPRFELLAMLALACQLRGDDRGMRAGYYRLASEARALRRPDVMARAVVGFFNVRSIGRLDAEWVSLAEETLAALGSEHASWRARVTMHLSLEYYWAGERRRGLELSASGEDMARKLTDPAEAALALHMRLALLRDPDQVDAVLRRADEVLAMLPEGASPEVDLRVRLVRHDVLLETGRVAEARVECERVLARSDALRLFWPTRVRLLYQLMEGRHDEVEQCLRDAMRSGRLDLEASGEWTQNFMVIWFQLRLQQERLDEICPALGEWAERFPRFPGARIALALVHARAGRLDRARELVETLLAPGLDLGRDQAWLWTVTLLCEVCLAIGDHARLDMLESWLAPYGDRLVILASDLCLGSVSRMLGCIARARGRLDTAVAHLERALVADSALGAYLGVRTSADLAEACLARGGESTRRCREIALDSERLARGLRLGSLAERLGRCARAAEPLP